MNDIICPNCNSKEIDAEEIVYSFDYGDGVCVRLSANIPVRTCKECGLEFMDWKAESIIKSTISRHRSSI